MANKLLESEQNITPPIRHHIQWDVGTIIASLIGLLALLVAAYTAYIQRQQVRAQVWPDLEMSESDYLPSEMAGAGPTGPIVGQGGFLTASNAGVGPAIVRSLEVEVNGKPEQTWESVFKSFDMPIQGADFMDSSLSQTVVPAGHQTQVLLLFGHKAWLEFKHKFFTEATFLYCYCSTLGQCWMRETGKVTARYPLSGSCPKVPIVDQFHSS